jgi:hypothetical protein
METMFDLTLASSALDKLAQSNSDTKAGKANVVPMKAESYPIMQLANDATAAHA